MDDHSLLLSASLVVSAALILPLLFRSWQLWGRAAWNIVVLVVLTILLQRVFGSPVLPHFHSGPANVRLWEQLVDAGWWMIAARSAVGVARLVVMLETRSRETRFISDLIAGAVYISTALVVVNFVFGVPIGGLLATSGVLAIILGLALQSTLSDVFSGIAVGIEKPYRTGDLLWVEGGVEGHVIQVNWRSTHIATGQNNIAIVPNSVMAKARLVNYTLRTTNRRETITVRLDPNASPDGCMAALVAAVAASRTPLETPAAGVSAVGLQGDGAAYEISFSVPSSDKLGTARTELFGLVQCHLRHAGIGLAVAGRSAVPRLPVPTPAELLQESSLFGLIPDSQRNLLAEKLVEIRLGIGDTLIRQHEQPEALFLLASGTVEITSDTPGLRHVLHRMSPGGSLGAIGLITGAPYVATATALTPVRAYRLDGPAIADAIETSPELAGALEDLAARSQAAIAEDFASHKDSELARPEMFLTRMRSFLHRLSSDTSRRSA